MTLMTSCMASQQGGGRRPCLQHCWHIKAWRDHRVQCIHYFWINQTCLNLIKHVWTWTGLFKLVQFIWNSKEISIIHPQIDFAIFEDWLYDILARRWLIKIREWGSILRAKAIVYCRSKSSLAFGENSSSSRRQGL